MSQRVQRRRIKGWRMPGNTIYVGRGSKYGNPYSVERYGIDEALRLYRIYLEEELREGRLDLSPLVGKDLACWCSLSEDCHADILLEKLRTYEQRR